MRFLTGLLDSINRFRESSRIRILESEVKRLSEKNSELALEIRLREEENKVNQLAIDQLRIVIERDRERVQAESAIATYQAARLGVLKDDHGTR